MEEAMAVLLRGYTVLPPQSDTTLLPKVDGVLAARITGSHKGTLQGHLRLNLNRPEAGLDIASHRTHLLLRLSMNKRHHPRNPVWALERWWPLVARHYSEVNFSSMSGKNTTKKNVRKVSNKATTKLSMMTGTGAVALATGYNE